MMAVLVLALIFVLAPSSGAQTYVWPNATSKANSDEWLVKNHDRIRQMRPRLLVLNFANGISEEKGRAKVNELIAALRESSRYHGHRSPKAPPFLEYEVFKFVNLTDSTPAVPKLDGNSSKYPRVPNWKDGINFQYARLFQDEYTAHFDVTESGRKLSLSELVNKGYIHEVWFLAYQGNYGAPFESVEVKQIYDERFRKVPGKFVQAGNGGDPGQPFIGRSLRILFINVERGPGCAMESLGHSLEGMANSNAIPYLRKYFREYAEFDLDKKYGFPFDSLYARGDTGLRYADPTSIAFKWKGEERVIKNYVPAGNSVHFIPNSKGDYDLEGGGPIMTTINHFRMFDGPGRKDKAELWSSKVLDPYKKLANDCMGPWAVYWRQSMPGYRNRSKDSSGRPMKNWWPFLFY